jgi:protein ImuB
LRRYRPPLTATVELAGTAPAFVWTAAVAGAVKATHGPWRGSGEWWEAKRKWAREEWDAELETGGVYRLIRTAQGWFVEGEYD